MIYSYCVQFLIPEAKVAVFANWIGQESLTPMLDQVWDECPVALNGRKCEIVHNRLDEMTSADVQLMRAVIESISKGCSFRELGLTRNLMPARPPRPRAAARSTMRLRGSSKRPRRERETRSRDGGVIERRAASPSYCRLTPLPQRRGEIGDEIVGILDPHGKAHQGLADAEA